jgi:curved DNA-binding protein
MSWQPPPPPPNPQQAQAPGQPKQLTFYELLQVDPNANPTIIRYAYRFLAAMYHPDNADSGDAEQFRLITEAWKTLSDSTSRQAYDVQMGVQKAQPTASAKPDGKSKYEIPKASLSWSEIEIRLAILQVLLEARKKKPESGGASARMLMDCLNCGLDEVQWPLWYLREKGYIIRGEAVFTITVKGVDYIIDQLTKTQPLDDGKSSGPLAADSGANLPARLQ